MNDAVYEVGGKPIKGQTIGDLIDYLKQFPKDWTIAVPDYDGVIRYDTFVHSTNISTCLISKGEEVEW